MRSVHLNSLALHLSPLKLEAPSLSTHIFSQHALRLLKSWQLHDTFCYCRSKIMGRVCLDSNLKAALCADGGRARSLTISEVDFWPLASAEPERGGRGTNGITWKRPNRAFRVPSVYQHLAIMAKMHLLCRVVVRYAHRGCSHKLRGVAVRLKAHTCVCVCAQICIYGLCPLCVFGVVIKRKTTAAMNMSTARAAGAILFRRQHLLQRYLHHWVAACG